MATLSLFAAIFQIYRFPGPEAERLLKPIGHFPTFFFMPRNLCGQPKDV